MTTTDLAFGIFGIAAAFVLVRRVPSLWRGEAVAELVRGAQQMWPADPQLARAFVRAMPAAGVMGLTATAWYFLRRLTPAVGGSSVVDLVMTVVDVSLLAIACLGAVAFLTVILFNRPTRCVPPSMRSDRGVVR